MEKSLNPTFQNKFFTQHLWSKYCPLIICILNEVCDGDLSISCTLPLADGNTLYDTCGLYALKNVSCCGYSESSIPQKFVKGEVILGNKKCCCVYCC